MITVPTVQQAGPMSGDAPTEADRRRMRVARSRAHRRVKEIEEVTRTATLAAFREELVAIVRSASPFLVLLLQAAGLSLDDAAMLIAPPRGWPYRPRLPCNNAADPTAARHIVRHYLAGLLPKHRVRCGDRVSRQGHKIDMADGSWLRIEVAGHSLEATARIGPVRFETRFGELRVEMDGELPGSLTIGCIGRPIEQVVDHPALRGRGWLIKGVEDAVLPFVGSVLVVPTGGVPYRLPWAR